MKRYEYFVYILRCCDDRYYVGMTNDLVRRMDEHNRGMNETAFTHDRRPVKLVYSIKFSYVWHAIRWEKQLKGWSRDKKEALIRGDEKSLKWFAKRAGVRSRAEMKRKGLLR